MSKQTDEAFEAWWNDASITDDSTPDEVAREGWHACLAAYADRLELARRVEALPVGECLSRRHYWIAGSGDGRVRFLRGATALDALRRAHIGDEEGEG